MTISSSTRRAGPFAGNDSTVDFPFEFKVFAKSDVAVVLQDPEGVETTLTLDSDYTITLSPNQDSAPGGTVHYQPGGLPMATGYRLTMVGALAYDQTTDITNQGGFYPGVIERALDRIVVQTQQLAEEVGRSIKAPVSDPEQGDTYRDQLLQASAAAVAAAAAAAVSETNAADSEEAAAASANAAAINAGHALSSATAAQTSAAAAAASESNAQGSAAAAAASEEIASSSAMSAAANAQAVFQSVTDVALFVQQANGYRQDAEAAATGAEGSAQEAEYYATQVIGEQYAVPVGSVAWWPMRSSIQAGYAPADGQLLDSATYPDIVQMLQAGLLPVVTEAEWLADPLKRGAFTLGANDDGSTTIRLPDYNGRSAGSLGALFLRGDGARSAGQAGLIQADALQNITGEFASIRNNRAALGSASGVFFRTGLENLTVQGGTTGSPTLDGIGFDASRVARTADETRSINVTGCWVVKLFGSVVNPGSADVAQLASDYAALSSSVQTLGNQITAIELSRRVYGCWTRDGSFTVPDETTTRVDCQVQHIANNIARIAGGEYEVGEPGTYVVMAGLTFADGSLYNTVQINGGNGPPIVRQADRATANGGAIRATYTVVSGLFFVDNPATQRFSLGVRQSSGGSLSFSDAQVSITIMKIGELAP